MPPTPPPPDATARLRRWIIDHTPVPLLTHAHEVFLAVAVLIIGGGLLAGDLSPDSVDDQVPMWMSYCWAATLFSGSAATLVGLFATHPRIEWVGQMLLGWGTGFYSLAILTGVPFEEGAVAGLVFVGLALVSWWRAFKITSTVEIQHKLTRVARVAVAKRSGRRS